VQRFGCQHALDLISRLTPTSTGQISFTDNNSNEKSFNFQIGGAVAPATISFAIS
jgi:hypothetical protein